MGSTTSTERVRALALCLVLLVLAGCASAPKRQAFVAPLDRMVVSAEFGERRGLKRRSHKCIDLRAPHGTPVAAVGEGKIIFRGKKRGFGRLIVLDHGDDLRTYYAHMSDFAVGPGERVGRGQTVGFVGQSGNASGPHLHLEVRQDGKSVDPRRYVAF